MKRWAFVLLIIGVTSCGNDNKNASTDETGTRESINDTNHLITDSVEVPDTTTAAIDAMKKRN